MITEKEIEQAAKEYAPIEPSVNDSNELKRESFKAGANFVLKDMDSEMEKFDEWKESVGWNRSVKNDGTYVNIDKYVTFSELLQIYKNRDK